MLPNIHIHKYIYIGTRERGVYYIYIYNIYIYIYYILYILYCVYIYIYTYCSEGVADLIPHEDKLCIRVGNSMLVFFQWEGMNIEPRSKLFDRNETLVSTKSNISGVC